MIANRKKEIVLLLSILTLAGLYDLHRGPGERYNVMEFNPKIVEKLEKIANEAREDLGDDLTNNPGKNRREPGRIEK